MVVLEPMSEEDFQSFLHDSIADYAEDHTKAGNWDENEALERSKQEFERLLPEGKETADHYLYRVVDSDLNKKVGDFWMRVRDRQERKEAFIYDIVISESDRGKGYGGQTMLAAEEEAKKLGVSKMWLHVFGHNQVALHLYEKLGYIATDIQMAKEL